MSIATTMFELKHGHSEMNNFYYYKWMSELMDE